MNEAYKIRRLTAADLSDVISFWQNIPGMGIREKDDSPEGLLRFLKRNPDTCFAAESDSGIIGTVLAGDDGRRGHLYHVAVAPDKQGRGIGKDLVRTAMQALAARGITKTTLVVFTENAQGNAFWEKLGFTPRPDLIYRNRQNF
ncbi:MAG: GNAT family N-acetyltransferase [Anaerolineaceae bacterium]|nr:GNAT family N-acetyltransferase [Anaerolineaceae bacterium]